MKPPRRLVAIILVIAALLVYQGDLSWLSRSDAGWRQGVDAINDIFPANGTSGDFDISGKVVRVADGDTLSVLDDNKVQYKIRLFGIDTPELDQPFGRESSRALSKLVSGKRIGVVVKNTDQFDRSVGLVFSDSVNINVEMVRGGNAWWYRRYASTNSQLREAEEHARSRELGLWSGRNPVEPWEWRRGKRH